MQVLFLPGESFLNLRPEKAKARSPAGIRQENFLHIAKVWRT
jgi:hypothetical protein